MRTNTFVLRSLALPCLEHGGYLSQVSSFIGKLAMLAIRNLGVATYGHRITDSLCPWDMDGTAVVHRASGTLQVKVVLVVVVVAQHR